MRISDEIIEEIRIRRNNGESIPNLAKEYNLSESGIYRKLRDTSNSVIDEKSFKAVQIDDDPIISFNLNNHSFQVRKTDLKLFIEGLKWLI